MKNINLLVLTQDYPSSSAGSKRVQHLLEQLGSLNVNIKVLSFGNCIRIKTEKGLFNNIEYERIGSGVRIEVIRIFQIVFYYMQGLYIIFRYKKSKKKNIIYSYGAIDIKNIMFILFAKLVGYKVIIDIVEDYNSFTDEVKRISRLKFYSIRKMDKLNVYMSDAIVVISTFLKNKYERIKANIVVLIPITAKAPSYIQIKKTFNIPFLIVYAGTFGDKDNVQFIIDGFNEFHDIIHDSKLLLIGGGLNQMKYKYKYEKNTNIEFTGFVDDEVYYNYLKQADVLCACRINSAFANAGFPFKLGEFLATGNPVIVTNVSDIKVYLNEEEAYFIEPENTTQFIEALFSIISNPKQAFSTGYKGFEACREKFSPKNNGIILYNLINNI